MRRILCVLALFTLVFSVFPKPAFAAPDDANATKGAVNAAGGRFSTDDFDVTVNCGLEGNMRPGIALPVKIAIESKRQDFSGVIRMIVPGGEQKPVAYEREVLLTKGSAKEISMSIYADSAVNLLYLQIDNERGRTVAEKKILIKGSSNSNCLVGVLSEDYTALNYLDGKEFVVDDEGVTAAVQLVELTEKTFPELSSGLEVLSYLVVSDYDTSRLSEEQIEALTDWVAGGGILILGTGAGGGQTLSALGGIVSVEAGETASGELALEDKKSKAAYTASDGIRKITLDGGRKLSGVLTEERLVWAKRYARGAAIVCAMSLGQEPLTSWNDRAEFAARLLEKSILTDAERERLYQLNGDYAVDAVPGSYYMDRLFVYRTPNMAVVVFWLLFFLALCPILYLILKKMDKRGLLWVLIPALSVFVTIMIFVSTAGVRIRHPQAASVTAIYGNQDESSQQRVYMSVMSPAAGTSTIKLSKDLSRLRTATDEYFDPNDRNSKEYKLAVREGADGYQIGVHNTSTFGTFQMSMERMGAEWEGSLESDLVITLDGVRGTITNRTGYDLKAVVLELSGQSVLVGNLKAGESTELEAANGISLYDDSYSDLYQEYGAGFSDFSRLGLQREERRQILAGYDVVHSNLTENEGGSGNYLFATLEGWEADYVEDPSVKEFNRAVYICPLTLNYEGYEDARVLSLEEYYSFEDEKFDPTDQMLYEQKVEAVFDLSEAADGIYALMRSDVQGTESVRVYAWNPKTKQYDPLFEDGASESFGEKCPYLDDEGKLRLMYEDVGDVGFAPKITVIANPVPDEEMGGVQ